MLKLDAAARNSKVAKGRGRMTCDALHHHNHVVECKPAARREVSHANFVMHVAFKTEQQESHNARSQTEAQNDSVETRIMHEIMHSLAHTHHMRNYVWLSGRQDIWGLLNLLPLDCKLRLLQVHYENIKVTANNKTKDKVHV